MKSFICTHMFIHIYKRAYALERVHARRNTYYLLILTLLDSGGQDENDEHFDAPDIFKND